MSPMEIVDLVADLQVARDEVRVLRRSFAEVVVENDRLSRRVDELLTQATRDLDVVRAATAYVDSNMYQGLQKLVAAVKARAGK